MKSILFPATMAFQLFACLAHHASAQSILIGGGINIGSGNTVSAPYSSVMIGHSNSHRDVNDPYGAKGTSAVFIGSVNRGAADRSLFVGSYNTAGASDEYLDGHTLESLIIGGYNSMMGDHSAIIGRNNVISRMFTGEGASADWRKPRNTLVTGTGLLSRHDNCLIAGRFNLALHNHYLPPSGPQPLFVIGNGTALQRSNALVVLENGDIIIPKRQGDISMGIYDN